MEFKIFACVIVLASITELSSSASCQAKNYHTTIHYCVYEVHCDRSAGSVTNPNCDEDPYVKFFIRHSNTEHLSTGFFSATNFDSRVREIKAEDNSWVNIESSAFRYYPKCLNVDLSNNNIVHINAEAFRNLPAMVFLNLSGNSIETFHSKSFLITDNKYNDLHELDLSSNKLKYLGSELNEVSRLKKIYLQDNRLESLADDAFMNLKDLTHLYMQRNLLTSVNLSLIHLKSLTTLDISNNHLIKLSGYEINRLVALIDLNISHNELVLVESDCFSQASNLKKVDFSFNNIKMSIENVMFINNNKLNYLDFYNNRIVGVQENVFQNCDLNYLNLTNNNITGDIKEKTLSNLINLTKLDMSQQRLTGIRNNAFTDMKSLLHLNLSRNSINVIENFSFVNASNITVLDLSYNKIPNLLFMNNGLERVTELYLNNNNITIVPRYIFQNQTQVKILDLSMNNIIRIEQYSLPLSNLQYLYVMGNRINGALSQNVFSPAKYLRFLDLSHFNISQINSLAFTDLPVLAKLNISNNHIESVEVDSFKGIDNLFSLDISYNDLIDFKFNSSKLTNLKALYLSNNKLTNVSGLFSSTCRLSYLDLSNNNITDISEMGSDIFPNLTVLFLDNNNLKKFNNPKTNSLTTLIDLGLSSNGISDVNLSYFKELMSIDLSNNNLNYINVTFLENNEYLQALDVSRNNITELPPGTFKFMKNLKLLNLSSNYLSKLRFGSLKGLHKTEILDLSRNNIAQIDVDMFHECDELKTLIIDYNRIKTFDVERLILISLKKLRTLSIGGNPILCREIVHSIKSANTTFYAIRQVEVTSIDKIYHEDNVHGIKCGDNPDPVLSVTISPNSTKTNSSFQANVSSFSSTLIVLIWCSLLTIVLVACGAVAYIKLYKKRVIIVNRNMNLQMRQSLDSNVSDFQSDLLS